MLLIYAQKITPRMTYTFRQVLGRILGIKTEFTSKVEKFIAHKDLKLSYGKSKMGNELFIKAAGLLNNQGISEDEFSVNKWGEIPCFYDVGEESDIPYDIFSASFYLLSRYEEYLPHVKDAQGRFPAEESIAYKEKFLRKPVVDLWAYKFKEVLQQRFPNAAFQKRSFKIKNVLTVAEAYKYRKKGLTRNFGGAVGDLFKLRIKRVLERIQTQLFFADDPYDVYDELLKFSKQNKISWEFMFQLSDYSLHNKNIGYNRLKYHSLIKSMGDYGKIGLLLGYEALFELKELKKEKKRWENIVNRDLEIAMSNNDGLNLPHLYNNYDQLEIKNDYSMGYIRKIGFRAGTCTPFLYYDLNLERISPLMLHPVACNSISFRHSTYFEVKTIMERLRKDVKEVEGYLIMRYKNSNFAYSSGQEKFFQLLEKMNASDD